MNIQLIIEESGPTDYADLKAKEASLMRAIVQVRMEIHLLEDAASVYGVNLLVPMRTSDTTGTTATESAVLVPRAASGAR